MKKLTKNWRAIFALVLAVALFAIAMFALPALTGARVVASADGGSSPNPGSPDPGDPNNPRDPDPQPTYTKLYYFSDYSGSVQYVSNGLPQYLSQVGLSANDIEYYYWQQNFLDMFYTVSDMLDMQNAYVIFEMRQDLPQQDPWSAEELAVDVLDRIFGRLVDQNCKLMIIFGVDENRLYGYTNFLSHADIQVNIDVFYPFFWSMYDILDSKYGSIFSTSNLLSPSLSKDKNYEYSDRIFENWFFENYIIPEYRELSKNSLHPLPANVFRNQYVWENYINLNHNFWGWHEYCNGVDEPLESFLRREPVGIGMTDYDEYASWEFYIYYMRQEFGMDFPIFIYNDIGFNVANWVMGGTKNNVYYSGNIAAILNKYLPLIMQDFILGNDLTKYDNWSSASQNCFKPILPGEDGWIKNPGVRAPSQCYMDYDDRLFLRG